MDHKWWILPFIIESIVEFSNIFLEKETSYESNQIYLYLYIDFVFYPREFENHQIVAKTFENYKICV